VWNEEGGRGRWEIVHSSWAERSPRWWFRQGFRPPGGRFAALILGIRCLAPSLPDHLGAVIKDQLALVIQSAPENRLELRRVPVEMSSPVSIKPKPITVHYVQSPGNSFASVPGFAGVGMLTGILSAGEADFMEDR